MADADNDSANWLTHGRTYSEQRFSPLDQINRQNVEELKLVWFVDLEPGERGQASTPLVVDGVMYVTTSWSRVIAVDAATGKERWRYDPKVPGDWGVNACCDVVNRGVAFWEGKVYLGTLDGRLVALDAATGTVLWETVVQDRGQRTAITGAPRVIKGRVFIGGGGGEFGVRGLQTAVDANTGKILWRTYTVPGDPAAAPENLHLAAAARTWNGSWWARGGGGTVWDAMAYDPALDLYYIGTGNGSPWPQSVRSPQGGDNLYVSSILALRGETGEYVWHYQTTPGDEWGYDAASQLILAELIVGGALRPVLMQASANGFFYVLDRATGALLSADAYVPTSWAKSVDPASGRPVETPSARYSKTGKPFLAQPGPQGAHSWDPMAYSPVNGLVYIPAMVNSALLSVGRNQDISRYALNTGTDIARRADSPEDSSRLIAWDPARRKAVWTLERPTPVAGGVLATAGNLVFQGSSQGFLQALDADSGKPLWQVATDASITAAPITYSAADTQYVAVVAGAGGGRMLAGGEHMKANASDTNRPRLLVYALTGAARLPPESATPAPAEPPAPFGTPAQIRLGGELFALYCARCHGAETFNAGPLTDLKRSSRLGDAQEWNLVVYAGLLGPTGMPGFMAELRPEEAEALRAFVIARAHAAAATQPDMAESTSR